MRRDAPVFTVKIGPIATADKGVYLFTADPVDVTERVISFEFDDDDQKADQAALTLNNFDLALFDDPNWKHGNGLVLSWGYAGNMTLPRTCVIQKITGSIVMKVTALSAAIAMNKVKTAVTWENMTRSAIVAAIATANGFAPSAQFIDDSSVVIPATHQARMTDAEFMAHLAKREGFVFYVGPDGLHWERRKMNTKPMLELTYYTDPGAGDILSWDLENDVTVLPGLVTAMGRDPLAKTTIQENGSNTDTHRDVTAPIAIAVVQRTGQTVAVNPATPTAAAAVVLTNAPNSAAAKREADGKYIKSQHASAKISLELVGNPALSAKMVVSLQGISKRLSGNYYVKNAKHKVSASSYTVTAAVVTDGLHGGPGTAGAPTDGTLNTKPTADGDALNAVNVTQRTGEISYTPNTGSGT